MTHNNQKDEITRVRVAFVINLIATLVSFLVLLNLIDTHATWRIVCGVIGCIAFISFTTVIYSRLARLQKEYKQQEQRVS
jgi:hypothetical protein